jgi:ribosomal RNA-processing protein 12
MSRAFAGLQADRVANRQLVVVLDAINDVIRDRNPDSMEPSATEYFAALLTTMESGDGTHCEEMLTLMLMVLPTVPKAVMRVKFPAVSSFFQKMAKGAVKAESDELLLLSINCIGVALCAQDTTKATWNKPSTMKLFNILLHCLSNPSDEISDAAGKPMVEILSIHAGAKLKTVALHVSSVAEQVISRCKSQDCTQTLKLLDFLQSAARSLPVEALSKLSEPLMRLPSLGHAGLAKMAMHTLDALAQTPMHNNEPGHDNSEQVSFFLVQFLTGLLDLQPSALHAESDPAGAFASAVGHALVQLHHTAQAECQRMLPRCMLALCSNFQSPHTAVHTVTLAAIRHLLPRCITSAMVAASVARLQSSAESQQRTPPTVVENVLCSLQGLLQFRYQHAWQGTVLPLLSFSFELLGASSSPVLVPLLLQVAELHESLEHTASKQMAEKASMEAMEEGTSSTSAVRRALQSVVGSAVRHMGEEELLRLLPLDEEWVDTSSKAGRSKSSARVKAKGGLATSRQWLVPVLREHIGKGPLGNSGAGGGKVVSLSSAPVHRPRLAFFQSHILGLARKCENRRAECDSGGSVSVAGSAIEAKHQSACSMQLWSLLPGFCEQASDVTASFKNIARILGKALEDKRYPELMMVVCGALQTLIKGSRIRAGLGEAVEVAVSAGGDEDADEEDEMTGGGAAAGRVKSRDGFRSNRRSAGAELAVLAGQQEVASLRQFAKNFIPLLFKIYESFYEDGADSEDKALEAQSSGRAGAVQATVSAFASIAEPSTLPSLFRQLLQKLLSASTAASTAVAQKGGAKAEQKQNVQRARALMGLVIALVPSLDRASADLLYRASRPQITAGYATDQVLQKRAYQAILLLCKHHHHFLLGDSDEGAIAEGGAAESAESGGRLKELLELLAGSSLLSCGAGAKRTRLLCLGYIVNGLGTYSKGGSSGSGSDASAAEEMVVSVVRNIVGEVMLCVKESNLKARNAAFALVLSMGEQMDRIIGAGSASAAGPAVPGIVQYLHMVIGGLAGTTDHMRSACVLTLSRVLYHFYEHEQLLTVAPQVLQTVLILVKPPQPKAAEAAEGEQSAMETDGADKQTGSQGKEVAVPAPASVPREVAKSILSLLKVCVAILPEATLKPLLPELVASLLGLAMGNQGQSSKKDTKEFRFREDGGSNSGSTGRLKGKVRTVMVKLTRRFGHEEIEALVPVGVAWDGCRKLMVHIKRTASREKSKKGRKGDEGMGDGDAGGKRARGKSKKGKGKYEELFGSDSDDSDDDDDAWDEEGEGGGQNLSARARARAARAASLEESGDRRVRRRINGPTTAVARAGGKEVPLWMRESNLGERGEVVDLLDAALERNLTRADPKQAKAKAERRQESRKRNQFEVGADGRMVINDPEAAESNVPSRSLYAEDGTLLARDKEDADCIMYGKIRGEDWKESEGTFAGPSARERAAAHLGGRQGASMMTKRKADGSKRRDEGRGGAKRAKGGAGGDVKKKGQQFDPYAWVPLDPKLMGGRGKKGTKAREKSASRFAAAGLSNGRKAKGKSSNSADAIPRIGRRGNIITSGRGN